MRVLVTDGDARAALAVTRSLGRAGHEVIVGATRDRSLAGASRYCRARAVYPDPASQPDAFLDAVADVVADRRIDALVPITDVATFMVTGHRHRFGSCVIPCADADVVERAADKVALVATARRIGVPVPHGVVVRSADDVPAGLTFPLVVKPWKSRIRTASGWASTSVSHAASADALARDLAGRAPHEFPVMLQEKISGPGAGVFACIDRGRPLALFSHRRLRERPPWGGVSVLAESAPLSSPAREFAIDLLREIGWQGVAMVEFKVDDRDGLPKLMEINGRFWGSLQLAVDAGVDFPAILLDAATGRATPGGDAPAYALGVRTRWLWGDVDALLQTLLRKGRAVGWDPPRLAALVDFARFRGAGLHYDNPKWDDPSPFVFETQERLATAARALMPARRRARTTAPAATMAQRRRPAAGGTLDVRSVATLADVGLDQDAWNTLAAGSGAGTVFQTHQFIRAWMAAYGDQHEPWFVVAREGGAVVGVAPLVIERRWPRSRVVRLMGTGRADYCGLIAASGRADVETALLDHVLADERWDVLDFGNLQESSATPGLLRTAGAEAGFTVNVEQQFLCPTLLVEGHEAEARHILAKPSLRRRVDYFSRMGPLSVRDVTTAAEILPRLEAFFAQHVARWARTPSPSLFTDEHNRRFYRELVTAFDGSGWLLFSTIEANGRTLACHLGFDYDGAVLWYKPSFDVEQAAHSPGLLMVHHLVDYAVRHARRELDFTVGDEPFKRRFTNHVRRTVRLRVYRAGRAALYGRSRQIAASLVRKSRQGAAQA